MKERDENREREEKYVGRGEGARATGRGKNRVGRELELYTGEVIGGAKVSHTFPTSSTFY